MSTIKKHIDTNMVTHTCKLVVICNQDRYQRFVGSRQHQRQVPSHKLQVTSGIYSSTQSTQSTHSSYKSQVTSYKLQVTNKDKEIQSLLSLFCCCLARNISEPPRNCEDLFMIFFCCYVAFVLFTRVCSPVLLPTGCV